MLYNDRADNDEGGMDSIEAAMRDAPPCLSSVSDDALWEELKRRHETALMLLYDKAGDDDGVCKHWFHGGLYACVGMAQSFIHGAFHGDADSE